MIGMIRILVILAALCLSGSVGAEVYIDCSCAENGDGTSTSCAASSGAAGAKNAAVTSVSASTSYSYARGTTCTLAGTAITVNQDAVVMEAHGSGARPVIDGNAASYAVSVTTSNGFSLSDLDLRAGVTGALNLSSTTTGGTVEDITIESDVIGFTLAAAGATNIAISGLDVTCSGAASICTAIATNGGGITFEDSTITLTATDKSSTSLIGLRLSGTAATIDNVDISGGNYAIEIRTTDGHTVRNSEIADAATSGVRIRDSSSNIIEKNNIHDIWNGLYYDGGAGAGAGGGAGAGVDLIDVSDACGANVVRQNHIHDTYQGIVDQCDVEGANQYYANVIHDYLVNGISYQSDGSEGLIANNSIDHAPYDPVTTAGHGIVIQSGSVTTTARIINNSVTCSVLANNVQCVALPLSASTGATYIDNNNWYAQGGAHIGKLGETNYDTLAAWQTALGTDADTTGDDAAAISADPKWVNANGATAESFKTRSGSPLRRAGIPISPNYTLRDYRDCRFDIPPTIGAFEVCAGDAP